MKVSGDIKVIVVDTIQVFVKSLYGKERMSKELLKSRTFGISCVKKQATFHKL